MSNDHRGNVENQVLLEEHDGLNNAKRVHIVAGGSGQATITLIGLVTLAPSPNYIGLVTVGGGVNTGNVTLNPGPNFIGIVTVTNIDRTLTGNVTISDSKGFIGLVTVVQSAIARTITGNITLSDSKGFIGLVTVGNKLDLNSVVTLSPSPNLIGLVSVAGGAIEGTVASGSADSGNPLKVGAIYNSTRPTFTTGERGDLQIGSRGSLGVTLFSENTQTPISALRDNLDAVATTGSDNRLAVVSRNTVFNGSSWDRMPGSTVGVNVVPIGNVTLSDSKGFIGLTTSVNGQAWPDPKTFIGLVTIGHTPNVAVVGNVTLSDSKGFIGLVTVVQSSTSRSIVGNVTLSDSKGFIGLVTVVQSSSSRSIIGNVTLSDPKTFIGLVTAVTRNAGTTKTLIHKTIAFAQASIVTIAVPSSTFHITHLALNANASTRVNIKSGVTYLTGNVTLGMNLNPGGGWVENGSPDSPVYIGLAAAAAIVIEKFDLTGTSAQIGGKLIYYDE